MASGVLVHVHSLKAHGSFLSFIRTRQSYGIPALKLQALSNHPLQLQLRARHWPWRSIQICTCTYTWALTYPRDATWCVLGATLSCLYDTYEGSKGLNEDLRTDPPCHSRACAIQSSSTAHNSTCQNVPLIQQDRLSTKEQFQGREMQERGTPLPPSAVHGDHLRASLQSTLKDQR